MGKITRVGVDLAKNLIQVHAVDATGKVIASRVLKRESSWPGALICPRVALSRWRLAAALIIGAANSRRLISMLA
jgi:hypothetical protein